MPPGSAAVPDRLSELLGAAECGGLVVVAESGADNDLAPFVGTAHLGEAFLIVPRGGPISLGFLTDMERDEAAATGLELLNPASLGLHDLRAGSLSAGAFWARILGAAFAKLGLAPGQWAVAGHAQAGTLVEACSELARSGWVWRSGGEILRRWRKFKPKEDLPLFREAADGVCAAMRGVARILAVCEETDRGLRFEGEALRIGRLRAEIRKEFASRGLSEPHGNILAAGAAAGVPHTQGDSGRELRAGEPLIVDLYPRGRVYADCTRTFCVGSPDESFLVAYAAVRAALEQAHASCRPGMRGWELQQQTCELFEARGFPTIRQDPSSVRGYVHGLGHGVGLELHEYPSFRELAGDEGRLEWGDVLTLEPGLYDEAQRYGVRLEDLCYLGASKMLNLTPLPLDWDPRAWSGD